MDCGEKTMTDLIPAKRLVRAKDRVVPPSPVLNLHDYHHCFIRSSGGKDSQAMLDYVVSIADAQGYSRDNITVTHADLGRVEWAGTVDIVREQVAHYGLKLIVVKRVLGDLLEHIEKLGKFPMPTQRFCTSDHKRAQQAKTVTAAHAAWKAAGNTGVYKIVECLGMRAQESSGRSKLEAVARNDRFSTRDREVTTWLPIHDWRLEKVWDRIKASGVRHHPAYDYGMPRLSCAFCIYAPRAALLLAGKHNPELLAEYVRVEEKIGHAFQTKMVKGKRIMLPIADVQREVNEMIAEGREFEPVEDWVM
jgi:3'-phosphoadenosine 5'-phosphosulfate sulfotransferase (PAPS reductase)/FAD synthetase